MKRSQVLPYGSQSHRRWRVPPALLHGSEALEGGDVLQEIHGGAGLLLWQALRDVFLWASTPPVERQGLFSAEAERKRLAEILAVELEGTLEEPLGVLTAMVGQPERVRAERVAFACRQISQWAEEKGALGTALAFSQAAALACPGDASAAFKVGQIARKRAENARAESWFRRAIALARQSSDWPSYSLAFLGLGTLYMQRGNLPTARRFYIRCLRAAKRHSLREIQGGAYHDLFVIAVTSDRFVEAEEHARAAFYSYGPTSARVPKLAHDVAYFWLMQGYFARALSVFQALLPRMESPADQAIILPNIIRAAGGAGERETFENAWKAFQAISDRVESSEGFAEALLELARGALSLKEWTRAEEVAHEAMQRARQRGEARILVMAESLLDALAHQRRAEACTLPATEENSNGYGDALAQEFIRSLATCG